MSIPNAPVMRPRAIPHGALRTTLALTIILGLLPVVAAMIAIDVARLIDCQLDLGMIASCPLGPFDLGPVLHGMAMFGWFAVPTWPLAMALFVVWLAVVFAFVVSHWLMRFGLARKGYGRV
ncbi:MAG: hypothetical protein ACTHLY_03775 [Pseudolabrys sp.]